MPVSLSVTLKWSPLSQLGSLVRASKCPSHTWLQSRPTLAPWREPKQSRRRKGHLGVSSQPGLRLSIKAFRARSARMPASFASQRVFLEGNNRAFLQKNEGIELRESVSKELRIRPALAKADRAWPEGARLAVATRILTAVGCWSICTHLAPIIILMSYGNRRRVFSYSSSSSSLDVQSRKSEEKEHLHLRSRLFLYRYWKRPMAWTLSRCCCSFDCLFG